MKRRRFLTEDWLVLGLNALSDNGPEAVKLVPICQAAGLTRGSFYHHFDDHTTFLVKMTEHWFKQQTQQVAAQVEHLQDPEARATKLNDAALAIDYKLELGIRELARRNRHVAAIVARADDMRLSVLADLYAQRFGIDQETARDMAFLEYAAFAGLILIAPELRAEKQSTLSARYDAMVRHLFAK